MPGIRLEAGDGTVITCVRLPRAVGDAVVAVEPLRHGLANAATGGICRVRGTAGSAILKVARLPTAPGPAKAFPCGAAKYSWFAPAIAGRAARDHIGPSSYGQDTSAAAAARRVTGLVTLIADWAQAA